MNNVVYMLEFYKLPKAAFACVRSGKTPLWGMGLDIYNVVCYDVVEIK